MGYSEIMDVQRDWWQCYFGKKKGTMVMQLCSDCQRKYWNERTVQKCCEHKLKE